MIKYICDKCDKEDEVLYRKTLCTVCWELYKEKKGALKERLDNSINKLDIEFKLEEAPSYHTEHDFGNSPAYQWKTTYNKADSFWHSVYTCIYKDCKETREEDVPVNQETSLRKRSNKSETDKRI